jgi:DNA-binding GntR family transcriptional regulator
LTLPFQFNPIEQPSLFSEIVQRVRHAIIYGEVGFGEHLSEPYFARKMAVSRIPLREALLHLSKEGIVTRVQNRGFFVISFSPADICEVFSLRSMLECMALARSIPCLKLEDFKQLEQLVEQQGEALISHQYDLLTQLDMRFHEYFCKQANHKRLLNTWCTYEMQCQMLIHRRFRMFLNVTPEAVKEDHIRLINAAYQRDIPQAMEITRSIAERVSRECIQMVQKSQHEGGALSSEQNQAKKIIHSNGNRSIHVRTNRKSLSKE